MIKISQSLINDVLYNSDNQSSPASCPLYLKYKYVNRWEGTCSEVMLAGKYFEWHLLGTTRDAVEPLLPRVSIKRLSPAKSATKHAMIEWLKTKPMYQKDKDALDLLKKEDLWKKIEEFPAEFDNGQPSTRQQEIDAVIVIAKQVLAHMGLDTSLGRKQVKLTHKDTEGHIDWIAPTFINHVEGEECIIDVKYTETKADDRYNGWADFQERTDAQVEKAKTQAGQYTKLYFENYGKWVPYYFFIFGRSGWVQIIKMTMLESGLKDITVKQHMTRDKVAEFVKTDWPARPRYNVCLECPFAAYEVEGEIKVCPKRSVSPEILECQF